LATGCDWDATHNCRKKNTARNQEKDRISFAFMNPIKCISFLVAMVFVVSCTGSSQNEGGQQPTEQTTQLVRQTTPAPADPTLAEPTPADPADPTPADRAQIENPLNVEPIAQEGEMSCWAACAEMIMRYVRKGTSWQNVPAPRQCEQTVHEYPRDFPDLSNCCDTNNNNSMKDGCSESGWPEFTAWNFTCNTNIDTSLPWENTTNPTDSITGQIDSRRPIAFSMRLDGGASHMMVLIGYDSGEKTMTYLYPDFGQPTKVVYNMLPLSEYNGEEHDCDFYNIQVSGDPPQ
jgi:hypothetical protein